MKKVCNVVILATDKAKNSLLLLNLRGGKHLEYLKDKTFTQEYLKSLGLSSYHLYITSNEEIQEGDWCIHFGKSYKNNIFKDNTVIVKVTDLYQTKDNTYFWKQWDKNPQFSYSAKDCRKIIATTDTSLKLPQIPQSFINTFIKEYNNGNVIDKVMVKYKKILWSCGCRKRICIKLL